jgi:hypothetical protein
MYFVFPIETLHIHPNVTIVLATLTIFGDFINDCVLGIQYPTSVAGFETRFVCLTPFVSQKIRLRRIKASMNKYKLNFQEVSCVSFFTASFFIQNVIKHVENHKGNIRVDYRFFIHHNEWKQERSGVS